MWSIVFFGDSDISRWPPSLYPSIPPFASVGVVTNHGRSGALLGDTLEQISKWKNNPSDSVVDDNGDDNDSSTKTKIHRGTTIANDDRSNSRLFICCARENDIASISSSGRSTMMVQIFSNFRNVLDALFPVAANTSISSSTAMMTDATIIKTSCTSPPGNDTKARRMIFFGPKFEPWLNHDGASRKLYTKLNAGLRRVVKNHPACHCITYVDCLTLFCTQPGTMNGEMKTSYADGILSNGGRVEAVPDGKYFHSDGLHLNDVGYGVWKQIVEEEIANIIA
jgi:hypothetical protein